MTNQAVKLTSRYYRTYPIGNPLGYAEEVLDLDLDRTVFLIIDVYGLGYDSEDGSDSDVEIPEFYSSMYEKNRSIIRNHIVPAKQAAKRIGLPVVYLTNKLRPGLTENSEWRKLSLRVHGIDVLESWKEPNDVLSFSKIVAPEAGEYLIPKQLYSGFFETQLDSLLRSLDAYNLVCVGFDSRICLGTTVIDAMYRNYRVIVLRDSIGTVEEPETAPEEWAGFMATRFIETNVGYTTTSADWVAA
jgi:nicotinamidase-related amidase